METTTLTPAVTATDVTKTFGSTTAVDNLSLNVPRGQIMALLGKNGAGKTTLIDVVLGLQRPDKGTTSVFGMSPREAIRRSLIGVVHQTGALPTDYTVSQTLHLFGSTHNTSLPLEQVMAETNLTHLAKRPIRKLSGGEQQRVRLALALLPDPLLLILDEPTAGMDATARREFWSLMRTQADRGRTIIFATHYLAEAQDFAERTVIMKDGRIIADADTDELRRTNARRTLRILVPVCNRDQARRSLSGVADAAELTIRWAPYSNGNGLSDEGGADHRAANEEFGELIVEGPSTDEAARVLLAIKGAHDLEIATSTLEDAFTELTA